MNNRIAMFPGSFDPPTNGHLDIIERASLLYEKLYIVLAVNSSKNNLFTPEERLKMLSELCMEVKNAEVVPWTGLTVDFARKYDTGIIIRGVRALTDFAYEFEIAETNKQLCPEVEVLFMPTNPKYFLLRSSMVKEVAMYGSEIKDMLPPMVSELLKKKFSK